MGKLNSLVNGVISQRVRRLGASFSGDVRAVAPLLSCDFRLTFYSGSSAFYSDDFMLSDLSLGSSGLSWSPHGGVVTVPMADVSMQYFTVQFYVSGDARQSPLSFPTLWLYERQFTDDGLLRLPEATARYSSTSALLADNWDLFVAGFDINGFEDARGDSSGWVRPDVELSALFPTDSGDLQSLVLCRFRECVFGTPSPSSFTPGQVQAMQWSQQVGFRCVDWCGKDSGSFFGRSSRSPYLGGVGLSRVPLVKEG